MSAAFVDFKRTGRGGSSRPGGWNSVTYNVNALLREGRPRICNHFLGSSVRAKKKK